jgi:hypothetical protein
VKTALIMTLCICRVPHTHIMIVWLTCTHDTCVHHYVTQRYGTIALLRCTRCMIECTPIDLFADDPFPSSDCPMIIYTHFIASRYLKILDC